jgi:SulP family sulfate permease
VLEAQGILDRIGADHLHGNVHRAVEAQRSQSADDQSRESGL